MTNGIKSVRLFLAFILAISIVPKTLSVVAGETKHNNQTNFLMAQDAQDDEVFFDSGDADVDYAAMLGLMKSHIITAEELVKLKNYELAQAQIANLVEKLYPKITIDLSDRNVADFKSTLNRLQEQLESNPNSPKVFNLLNKISASIEEAIVIIPKEQRNSPEFVIDTITQILSNAATKYEAATLNRGHEENKATSADTESVKAIKYQDSRGFVLYADELYKTIAEEKSQEDPEGHEILVDILTELKTAYPSIEPPKAPVKSPTVIARLAFQFGNYELFY